MVADFVSTVSTSVGEDAHNHVPSWLLIATPPIGLCLTFTKFLPLSLITAILSYTTSFNFQKLEPQVKLTCASCRNSPKLDERREVRTQIWKKNRLCVGVVEVTARLYIGKVRKDISNLYLITEMEVFCCQNENSDDRFTALRRLVSALELGVRA